MQDRAVETRRRILVGAAAVFDRRGFVAATLDEILEEIGVSKGALYFHFKGKDEVARAIIAEDNRWAAVFDRLVTDRPIQDIIDVTHALARALIDDPLLRASFRMAVEYGTFDRPEEFTTYNVWSQRLLEAFERASSSSHLLPDVDAAAAVDFLVTSFTGMQIVSQVVSGRTDLPERVASWWRFALPGLVPRAHLPRYETGGSGPT